MAGSCASVAKDGPAEEPLHLFIRSGFTVQNVGSRVVPAAELWVCAPLEETSTQRLVDWKTEPRSAEQTDALGNHLLHFVFSNVPPYAVKLVSVEATLAMKPSPAPQEADPERWLKAGPLYEYEDEAFERLGPKLPEGSPVQTARALYDWIRGYVRDAGYDGTDRGALYALTQEKGDCTEFATLFAALCRRAGIPARALGGYVVGRNTVLAPASFHNWAEFYADGRWQLADPQRGLFMTGAEHYVTTRVLGESDSPLGSFARFRYLGEGIKAVMNE